MRAHAKLAEAQLNSVFYDLQRTKIRRFFRAYLFCVDNEPPFLDFLEVRRYG